MRLIVGLGNPGPAYANTRHNVGFIVAEALALHPGWRAQTPQFSKAISATMSVRINEGLNCALIKPLTYMNESGIAVAEASDLFLSAPPETLAVVDDVHLPVGKLRLRAKGSCGGHNGIASLKDALGTDGFPRLRIGVGEPPQDMSRVEHVLGSFTESEMTTIVESAKDAAEICTGFAEGGYQEAANRFAKIAADRQNHHNDTENFVQSMH